jgi:hypothetical protein
MLRSFQRVTGRRGGGGTRRVTFSMYSLWLRELWSGRSVARRHYAVPEQKQPQGYGERADRKP